MAKKICLWFSAIIGLSAPIFELCTGICGSVFFDPLPGIIQLIVYFSLPPALVIGAFWSEKSAESRFRKPGIALLTWAVIGSGAYSLWFLPIMPIAVPAVLGFGIGLFGLAPLFIFIAAMIYFVPALRRLKENSELKTRNIAARLTAILLPLLFLFLMKDSVLLGIAGSSMSSPKPAVKNFSLTLYGWVNEKNLLRAACSSNHWLWFLEERGNFRANARQAYTILTGREPSPGDTLEGLIGSRWTWDPDLGGDHVGKKVRNLYLKESTFDMIARPAEDYTYTEWTLVFENRNENQQEARGVIELPENAVVSKVSLWINGEEKPAAFASPGEARRAYQSVVRQSRDPLLVTWAGPGLVQFQCFPVPEKGTMQIRLGITAPIVNGMTRLPYLAEKNFEPLPSLMHQFWGEGSWMALYLSIRASENGSDRLKTAIPDGKLASAFIGINRSEDALPSVAPSRPVLLIDGTRDILKSLKNAGISEKDYAAVLVARPFDTVLWNGKEPLKTFLSSVHGYGAAMNPGALNVALELSMERHAPVVWVHGKLPAETANAGLEQFSRRSKEIYTVVLLSHGGSWNPLFKPMLNFRVDRVGHINDWKAALDQARIRAAQLETSHEAPTRIKTAVTHPERLVLAQLLEREALSGKSLDRSMRYTLSSAAVHSQLVTPFSGAVVLETQAQFSQNHLDPENGEQSIPSIPEPHEWALLIATLVFVLCAATVALKRKSGQKANH